MVSSATVLLFRRILMSLLCVLLSGTILAASTGGLLPFHGTIKGEVTVSLEGLEVVDGPPAEQISSHLGRGLQYFDELVFEPVIEDGTLTGLKCTGSSRCVAANGDLLLLAFELAGTFAGPVDLVYRGRFRILPGGTGRFAFDGSPGELGDGEIAGAALVFYSHTSLTLVFEHDFQGQIASVRGWKPS